MKPDDVPLAVRRDLAAADMDFCVTTPAGQRFCLVKFEKRSNPKGNIQFYAWDPAQEAWIAVPLRLTRWAIIKNAILDGTWPPTFASGMVATADGFEFAFNSNHWDPPDYRWHANFSTRTGRVTLQRGEKLD